jgi:hypothetical protein
MINVDVGDELRAVIVADLPTHHPDEPEATVSFKERFVDRGKNPDDVILADQGDLAAVVADQTFAFLFVCRVFARQVMRGIIVPQDWPVVVGIVCVHGVLRSSDRVGQWFQYKPPKRE